MATVDTRLAGGRAAAATSRRDHRAKIVLVALVALLAVLLVLFLPGTLRQARSSGSENAAATAASSASTVTASVPSVARTAPSAAAADASAAKLHALRRGHARSPFVPLVTVPVPAPSTTTRPSPAATTPTTTVTLTPRRTSPVAPTAALLFTNGRRQVVGVAHAFKVADQTFRVVAVTRGSVRIAVVGGVFANGRKTVTIAKGHRLTIVNTATGVRYLIRFANGTTAASTVVQTERAITSK